MISTASKALQEQIFFNDLPVVERALGRPAEAQLVKGLSNYLCLRRFDELKRGLSPRNAAVNKVLPMVEQWAAGTHEGDLAELDELPEDHPIVRLIASSSETRVGSGCPFFERCHVTRLRRHSEQARLLVVNHHLFFADLALKSGEHNAGVLPDYDAVILDEAHRIEDIATQFFGVEVSSSRIERLVKDAKRAYAGQHEASRLAELVGTLAESFLGEVNVWMGQIEGLASCSGPRTLQRRAPRRLPRLGRHPRSPRG